MASPSKARASTAKVGTTVSKTGTAPSKATTTSNKTSASAKTEVKQPGMGRVFLGMLILFPALLFIQFLLGWVDVSTKGALRHPTLVELPLLGKITPIVILYLAIVIGVYYLMIRFNVIPKAGYQQSAAQRAAAAANSKSSTSGKTNATTSKVANTKATSGGKGVTVAEEPVAKVKASEIEGENDDLYQQVKAQQRAQSRKRKSK